MPEFLTAAPPAPALRILFVFAWLAGGPEETEIRRLAAALDTTRYQIAALPCLQRDDIAGSTHADLTALGIDVDTTAYDMGFDDTIAYLAAKMAGYDIIVSCQNVADIYPALERLLVHPPLIEYGQTVAEAVAGPKHLTARYVGATEQVRLAAAHGMPGRAHHSHALPQGAAEHRPGWWNKARVTIGLAPASVQIDATTRLWIALFEDVLADTTAPPPKLFRSFMQGGFECSTHRLHTGRRLDVIAATAHDVHAEQDYRQLGRMGVRTVRDGVRWHLVEQSAGRHDFTSFVPMAQAALASGTQVIWDLLHYGWPEDIDIWTPAFVDRFAAFAGATARRWREMTEQVPFWCPVNEISFFAWGGGDVRYLNPFATGRGFELKVQLARASIAAMHALRDVDPRARFVHCEPLIAVHHSPETGRPRSEADGWHQAQFQAFDLLSGRMWPQIGGDPAFLDIVGVNYYSNNQWLHAGAPIDLDHPAYRPFSDLLFETYARYRRPIFVAETGVEDQRRAPWLRYVSGEVLRARQRGVPVEGICLYPILNHPGWDDDRACQNGLLTQHFEGDCRGVDLALANALGEWIDKFR